MKLCRPFIRLVTAIGMTASVGGQVAVRAGQTSSVATGDIILAWSRDDANGPRQNVEVPTARKLKKGVVVEEVVKGSDAEKMGFVTGDVILTWVRGEHHGLIGSPFDLFEVEIEELPHGVVTLGGLTGTASKSWVWPSPISTVQEGTWGLVVRPNFTGSLLNGYQAGHEAAMAGKSAEAIEHWQAAAQEAKNQQLPTWLAGWLWLRLAESLAANKELDSADRACQQAVELAREDSSLLTKLQRGCGDVFLRYHADEQARTYYRQALANLQNSNPLSLGTSSILTQLGRIAYYNDDPVQGVVLVGKALQVQEQLAPDSLIVASNLNRIGTMMQKTGNLDQSREYLLRAVALREKLSPQSSVLATSLQSLGDTLVMRGDPDKAEPYHLRALKLWEELQPGSNNLAGSLVDLANAADDRGDLAKAEEYYRRALEIQRRLQPRGLGTAASLNNLGLLLDERGQLAAAEESFKESLEIKEQLAPGSLNVASTLGNLGGLLAERGNLAQAEKYLDDALEICRKKAPQSGDIGNVYIMLGNLAWQRQTFSVAEDYYRKGLAVHEAVDPNARETGDALQDLGDATWKRGDVAEAEKYYLRALKIRENAGRASYADTLLALAEVAQGKQQWGLAAQRFEQALEALEQQTARAGGSEEVRANFRAQHGQELREYVDLLLAQNQIERAFNVLERSRSRILLETLAAARVDIRKGVDPELIRKERSLQANIKAKSERHVRLLSDTHTDTQIKALENEIDDLENEYQSLEAEIRSRSPAYLALTHPQPLDVKTVQHLLPENTLLLEYVLGDKRSRIFTVTADSLDSYELPPRAVIEETAGRLYNGLTERSRTLQHETPRERNRRRTLGDAESQKAALELSGMLLGPFAGALHAGSRLLVVCDGALHHVPFAALPIPGSPARMDPTLLITQHEVVSLPSASVLPFLLQGRRNGTARKEVAVFADPVFDARDPRVKLRPQHPGALRGSGQRNKTQNDSLPGADLRYPDILTRSLADMNRGQSEVLHLPRLAFTRDEANAILATVPAGNSMAAVDFEATRKKVVSGELVRYRVVHFATHALVDDIHPEFSGMVLSLVDPKGDPVDGFLGLEDIYNLELSADVVVLSACQTALGKEVNGEGIIGLTRGFMYAGTPRVVSTLWKVSDFATAKLMAHFYKAMERDGMKPAQALRHAQLTLRREKLWSAPYYWAGFVLQGDWH